MGSNQVFLLLFLFFLFQVQSISKTPGRIEHERCLSPTAKRVVRGVLRMSNVERIVGIDEFFVVIFTVVAVVVAVSGRGGRMEDVGLVVVVVRVVVAVTDVYGMVAVAVHGHGCCLCVLQTTTAISNAHCVGNAKG
ncbi:hypothetical protein V8G54_036828 [Vigna mungo]|uniref:Secreted protein n=1 Tax=Vigna mungo TaxID=3915 RepID=A0AAQ3MHG6_VIGMU